MTTPPFSSRTLRWSHLLIPLAIALSSALLRWTDSRILGAPTESLGRECAVVAACALMVLPVALYADAALGRGARIAWVVLLAVVTTAAICLLVSAISQAFFGFHADSAWARRDEDRNAYIVGGLDNGVLAVFAMIVFLNSRLARRIAARVSEAELLRIQLERQLVESRLAATQAQVDPQQMLDELLRVRAGLAAGEVGAEASLDELIRQLRNALARTVLAGQAQQSTP
jgi:hypothetical protein